MHTLIPTPLMGSMLLTGCGPSGGAGGGLPSGALLYLGDALMLEGEVLTCII